MIDLLLGWLERYPIVSIEDPLGEDDQDGFAAFSRAVGERCQVVADDLTVTDVARVRAAAAVNAANTLLIKPNQRGTLSETLAAWDAARAAGWGGIVSARSGETEDTTIVHLADRLGRAAAQGRLVRPLRAHGQVERGAAHRGGPGVQRANLPGRSRADLDSTSARKGSPHSGTRCRAAGARAQ